MPVKSIRLSVAKSQAASVADEVFALLFPHAYLIIKPQSSPETDAHLFATQHIDAAMDELEDEFHAEGVVIPVTKSGVQKAQLVTLGRTKSTDIVLGNPRISKLHAYFSLDAVTGAYSISDAGSTNGTVVNGRRLGKDEAVALEGGESISFAACFSAVFVTPGTLRQAVLEA